MNGIGSFWCVNGLCGKSPFELQGESKRKKYLKMSLDFIAGCLGGCAGVIVGHPMDTIKVHMQTQDVNKKYRGTWHCFSTLLREEKLRGLYRGMLSPLAGVGLVNAIVFGIYGNVQRYSNDPSSLYTHFIAGSTAGLVQSLVCSPIELAKTRLQLQTATSAGVKHKGSFDCLKYIMRTEGVRGTFRGLGITAIRDLPGFSSYFVSYEYMMQLPSSPNSMHAFVAGGFAGMFSWLFCYPMDVIKTCLQAESESTHPKYTGIIDCAKKGYAEDGLRFFFRGFTATMIRSFPSNAACFFVVYLFMNLTRMEDIDLVVQTADTLNVNNLTTVPIYHMQQKRTGDEIFHQRKLSSMKSSMRASNGYHEAVCHQEVEELAIELYSQAENTNGKYYVFEDNRLCSPKFEKNLKET